MPTLARAKERARRAEGASLLRQIGIALHLYGEEYRDLLPDCTTNSPKFFGSFWPWDLNTNLVTDLMNRGLTRPVLYCPSNPAMNDDAH